jgi:hypothetical protein
VVPGQLRAVLRQSMVNQRGNIFLWGLIFPSFNLPHNCRLKILFQNGIFPKKNFSLSLFPEHTV